MSKQDQHWYDQWIAALEHDAVTVDALGTDGTVSVAWGETYLVSATKDRAIAHL